REAVSRPFIQRRFTTSSVHKEMVRVRIIVEPASARCFHSYRIPRCNGRTLNHPNEVGQSGIESPASLLVTSAPATIRMKVAKAVNTAKRWCAELYGVERDSRDAPCSAAVSAPYVGRAPSPAKVTHA